MRTRGLAARWGTTAVTSALFATFLMVGLPMRVEVPLVPSAATTYLCSGYSGCRSAGYSDAGYGAVNNKMYWQMYSGHNCTNYAAYRVIKAGGPSSRPWSGGGNASEWGLRMSNITDQVPNVGAIAWWGRYSNGSGSAGHVAYVERVVSSTEIVISEDSWGGTFHWRRITKSSGRWPTGFIHFTDKTIAAKSAPTVSGTSAVGATLTASEGTWSVTPSAYTYDWVVGGVTTGVRTATFTPRAGDLGKQVTVKVRAKRAGYTDGVQSSTPTAPVAKGTFTLTVPPAVTGTLYVDEVLTATTGSWSPTPTTAPRWRWYADGVLLTDHYGPSRTLTPALTGKTIKVIAVARGTGYQTAWAPAMNLGQVLVGDIQVTSPATVKGGPHLGQVLEVEPGTYTPTDATRAYQWLRNGVPIPGATGPTYRLTAADVGSRVTSQVNLMRRNYAPWTAVLPGTARVTSPGTVHLSSEGRSGRAVVRVRVTAPGQVPVRGKVFVRVGSWSGTVRLVDGRVRVVVPQRRGERQVVVRYLGSTVVPTAPPARGTVTVR